MRIAFPSCIVTVIIASVAALAQPAFHGCEVFPKDNPWNQDISRLPVHPMSATWINTYGTTRSLHPDWGTPRI